MITRAEGPSSENVNGSRRVLGTHQALTGTLQGLYRNPKAVRTQQQQRQQRQEEKGNKSIWPLKG